MSTLEPDDVGPAVGGHLRASEADRQQVATLLRAAHGEGRLTTAELDERLNAAQQAETFDDLVPLTRDLVLTDQVNQWSNTPAAQQWSDQQVSVTPEATPNGPDLIFAVFGAASRKGVWTARRNISVLTLFGGTEIDLTRATFADNVCEISVFCLFGGVDIRVPDGVTVRNQTVAIFGGADVGKVAPPQPGAPTVIVKGIVGFGGVDVKPLKGSKRG